ncbi:MAG: DUF2059 domain-containing protein [Rhodobacteraceae bacterium]|nr:DUF2059 domain-containing protein [Paracoccaceae bacterium]
MKRYFNSYRFAVAAAPLMALALLLPPAPAAADDRAARLDLARAYVEATVADMDIEEWVRGMYRPLLAQVRAQGQTVTPEQEAEIEALYLDRMREPFTRIMLRQDEFMADMLSLEEIQALKDFYETDEGRSVLQKMPQIMEAQMPMMMAMVESEMEFILPELIRILDE